MDIFDGALEFTTDSINNGAFAGCAGQYFTTFPIDTFTDSVGVAPTITIIGPSQVTICEDFDIYLF